MIGDDNQLTARFSDARTVALICIFASEVDVHGGMHGMVSYHATVVKTFKGKNSVGERIKFGFLTDSLPKDEKARLKFIDEVSKREVGSLKFIFRGSERDDSDFYLEYMDTPSYSKEMAKFLDELKRQETPSKGEQDGTDQPATAVDSKVEGSKKTKQEPKGRPR